MYPKMSFCCFIKFLHQFKKERAIDREQSVYDLIASWNEYLHIRKCTFWYSCKSCNLNKKKKQLCTHWESSRSQFWLRGRFPFLFLAIYLDIRFCFVLLYSVCVCFFSYLFTFGAILNKLKRTFQDMDPNNDKKNNLYICMYINISWTHFDGIIQNVIYIFQLGVCLSTLCHCW